MKIEIPDIDAETIVGTFTIILPKRGDVMLNGPLEDRPLCLYLLEMAKDQLKRHWADEAKRKKLESVIITPGNGRGRA